MSKAIANLTQLAETITFSAQDNGESINVTLNELARGPAGLGVPAGGTEGQILSKATDTSYDTEWIDNFATSLSATVRNETGATLTKGTVVYISGSSNGKPLVSKASASTEAMSSKTFAILAEDIDHNKNGQAISAGLLRKVNTNGFTPGANIWLSTTPGAYTETMPVAPNNAVFLGNILSASTTQGEIEVRIQNGYELGELHNVVVTGASGGEVLRYNGTTTLWEDVSATELPIVSTVVARDSLGGSTFTSVTYNSVADSDFSAILRSSNDGSLESTPIIELPLVSGGLLVDANNLSDLSDFATARTNLGLGTTDSPTFKDLTIATGTITTSNPVEVTQTWNAVGVTFTGLKLNATDTASASGSLLMDLQVGGSSKFRVGKNGSATFESTVTCSTSFVAGQGIYDSSYNFELNNNGLKVRSSRFIGFTSGASYDTTDTLLYRDAAANLAQRNGTNAQTFRVYDTYTSATDYHRMAIATARATATGMSGATVTLTNLIPAGAVVVGVTAKVTTAITGATGVDIGTVADPDRFGANRPVALGTTTDNRDWTAGTIECFPSATSIILTAVGSNFTGGAMYVSVQYLTGQAD